jgi:hypothetical protein
MLRQMREGVLTLSKQAPVLFESHGVLRKFTLNTPKNLNVLDKAKLDLLRPRITVRRLSPCVHL